MLVTQTKLGCQVSQNVAPKITHLSSPIRFPNRSQNLERHPYEVLFLLSTFYHNPMNYAMEFVAPEDFDSMVDECEEGSINNGWLDCKNETGELGQGCKK